MKELIKEAQAYIEEYNAKGVEDFTPLDLREVITELEDYIDRIDIKHKNTRQIGGWIVADIDHVLKERLEWEGNLPYDSKIKILEDVLDNMDASIGVNWDSLEDATEKYLKTNNLI